MIYHFIFFLRLPSKSLQNVKNNYCVHPNGGWPGDNIYLVYWGGCNENRLGLDFFKLRKSLNVIILQNELALGRHNNLKDCL